MFGILRLFLAFLVVFSHLVGTKYLQHFGYYAVRGFFVLSGFLMTAGLNEVYTFDARRFWTNRFLRLMPLYYVTCLLTLIAVALAPAAAAAYIGEWQTSLLWRDAITDVIVLPLHHMEPHYRLVPTAWSLAVEIVMYILLFLFIARNKKYAMAGLTLGLIYHLVCIYYNLGFGYRYFGTLSATLSFSLGALIYFYRKAGVLLNITPGMAGVALGIWVGDVLLAGGLATDSPLFSAAYYLDTFLFSVIVAGLANAKFNPTMTSIDRALGDIAYPVFLVQWLAAFITALVLMPGTWRGWSLAFASIPVTLVISIGLAILNQKVIEPLRVRVRNAPVCRSPFVMNVQPSDQEQLRITDIPSLESVP